MNPSGGTTATIYSSYLSGVPVGSVVQAVGYYNGNGNTFLATSAKIVSTPAPSPTPTATPVTAPTATPLLVTGLDPAGATFQRFTASETTYTGLFYASITDGCSVYPVQCISPCTFTATGTPGVCTLTIFDQNGTGTEQTVTVQ